MEHRTRDLNNRTVWKHLLSEPCTAGFEGRKQNLDSGLPASVHPLLQQLSTHGQWGFTCTLAHTQPTYPVDYFKAHPDAHFILFVNIPLGHLLNLMDRKSPGIFVHGILQVNYWWAKPVPSSRISNPCLYVSCVGRMTCLPISATWEVPTFQ